MTRVEQDIYTFMKGTEITIESAISEETKEEIVKRFADYLALSKKTVAADIKNQVPKLKKLQLMQYISETYL